MRSRIFALRKKKKRFFSSPTARASDSRPPKWVIVKSFSRSGLELSKSPPTRANPDWVCGPDEHSPTPDTSTVHIGAKIRKQS